MFRTISRTITPRLISRQFEASCSSLLGHPRRSFTSLYSGDSPVSSTPPVNEDIDTKRARLLYQSTKRGILENDILLGGFARTNIAKLSPDLLVLYDALINSQTHTEWDIYYWISGAKPIPAAFDNDVMKLLKDYAWSSGKLYWYQKRSISASSPPPAKE